MAQFLHFLLVATDGGLHGYDLFLEEGHGLGRLRRLGPEGISLTLERTGGLESQSGLLDALAVLLEDFVEVLQGFCILGGGEDIVELLLQESTLTQRPVRVLLVDKDDVVENSGGDTHQGGDQTIHLGALVGEGLRLVAVGTTG